MYRLSLIVFAGVLVAAFGCGEKSPPGGPGATGTHTRSVTGTPHDTFRLVVPSTTTTLKQGEQKEVEITVDRAKDFHEDVALTFSAPKGLKVTPSSHTVKASEADTKVKVMVAADKDAPVGAHTIHVEAKPQTGVTTSADFKVEVKGA